MTRWDCLIMAVIFFVLLFVPKDIRRRFIKDVITKTREKLNDA